MATAIRRRRRFPWGTIVLVAVMMGLLLFVALASGVEVKVPFTNTVLAFDKEEPVKVDPNKLPEGKVWVLRAARDISAYSAISTEDLVRQKTTGISYVRFPWDEDKVKSSGFFTAGRVSELMGRVLKRDKEAGKILSENDFFERGTKPGVTAGIPLGYGGFRVGLGDIEGLAGLNRGDRFDIMAIVERDDDDDSSREIPGLVGERQRLLGLNEDETPKVQVLTIVSNGLVVSGTMVRREIMNSSSLMGGASQKASAKQEMVIAVRNEERAVLVEKLGTKAKVYCVPYSGRGEAKGAVSPPAKANSLLSSAGAEQGADLKSDASAPGVVEIIRGTERLLEMTESAHGKRSN